MVPNIFFIEPPPHISKKSYGLPRPKRKKSPIAVKNTHQFELFTTFKASQIAKNTSIITKRFLYEPFICFIRILDRLSDPNIYNLTAERPLAPPPMSSLIIKFM